MTCLLQLQLVLPVGVPEELWGVAAAALTDAAAIHAAQRRVHLRCSARGHGVRVEIRGRYHSLRAR